MAYLGCRFKSSVLSVFLVLVLIVCIGQVQGQDTNQSATGQDSPLPSGNGLCKLPKGVPLRTATSLPVIKPSIPEASPANYRAEFLKTYPEYAPFASELIIHHAVPPMVADLKPDLFTLDEINSLVNLRAICLSGEASVHLPIMSGWVKFLYTHPQATRKDIIDEAARVDTVYGSKFYPAVGIPSSQK